MPGILISEFMFGAHDLIVPIPDTVAGLDFEDQQRRSGSLYDHPLGQATAEFVASGWCRWQRDARSWRPGLNGEPADSDTANGLVLVREGWWPRRDDGAYRLADWPGGIELLAYVNERNFRNHDDD